MGLFDYKSAHCKHQDSCFINAIKQSLKALKFGCTVELILNAAKLLLNLFKKDKNIKELLKPSFQKLRIPLFFFLGTLIQKATYCIMRYVRNKEDGWNPFVAGALMGLVCMKLLPQKNWYLVLSLIAARVLDCLYKVAISKNILSSDHQNVHLYLLFAFGNIINSYGFFIEPDIIGSEIYGLYDRMAGLDKFEKRWSRSILLDNKRQLEKTGAAFFNDTLQKKIDKLHLLF